MGRIQPVTAFPESPKPSPSIPEHPAAGDARSAGPVQVPWLRGDCATEQQGSPSQFHPRPPRGRRLPTGGPAGEFGCLVRCAPQRQAGAIRFSFPGSPGLDDPEVQLLYLGGEGVACYDALYVAQGVAPKVLTILRPGTGFGFNWTDFRATGDSLEMAVARNRGGIPRGLLRDADELHMGYQWPELRLATCFGQKPGDSAVSPVLEWRRKS